jgi:bifunctional non-homologous end joining protein LigD
VTEIEAAGRVVRVTSPERVLWPEASFTKRDLVDYYTRVAPALLPHLADRPLTLARFPEGVARYGWYQTECRGAPEWLRTRLVGTQRCCVVDDLAGLIWAANRGTLELHPLLSRGAHTDEPAAVVFDLDPGPPAGLEECCRVALALREELRAVGLTAYAKTSGVLGLHVVIPLAPGHTFAQTKAFARRVARVLAERHPGRVLDQPARSLRPGKVLVDWGQNDVSRSLVAPYSPRAVPWPTVSTPLRWDEVEHAHAVGEPDRLVFLPSAVLERLERDGDLFTPVLAGTQPLPELAA